MENSITLSCDDLQKVVLSTFAAVCLDADFQYLSGPVTGGKRFHKWYVEEGRALPVADYAALRKTAVLTPNIDAIITVAQRERRDGRATIEPGSFEADFDAWGQAEFYALWDRVIERHAARVKFMDGWEFSAGCVFEFQRALRYGKPTVDMLEQPLTRDRALALIDSAVTWMKEDVVITNPADKLAELVGKIEGFMTDIAPDHNR
jgi:hypothetical protein